MRFTQHALTSTTFAGRRENNIIYGAIQSKQAVDQAAWDHFGPFSGPNSHLRLGAEETTSLGGLTLHRALCHALIDLGDEVGGRRTQNQLRVCHLADVQARHDHRLVGGCTQIADGEDMGTVRLGEAPSCGQSPFHGKQQQDHVPAGSTSAPPHDETLIPEED